MSNRSKWASASSGGDDLGTPKADDAYLTVKRMIINGELVPGESMSSVELARKVGVSRTPVREALQRLELAGYVSQLPNGGYSVVALTEEDIINVYRVRAVLEGLGTSEAALQMSRAELGGIEDLYDGMEAARAAGDYARLALLNSQFHKAIAAASGNVYLQTALDDIYETFERFRPVAIADDERRESAAVEHGELMDALRARDPERARSVAELHVERALDTRLRQLKNSDSTN